jgi:hypothetical protein
MSIRTGIALACIVSLGALSAACSTAATPTGANSPPSRSTEPAPPPTPGVSWLRVSPEQGGPNSAVSLDVACLEDLGPVNSPVLDLGALKGSPDGHQPWHLVGTATVRSDAAPGRYQISATCGVDELTAAFTVVSRP